MHGVYRLSGSISGVTTAKTLLYIETAATVPIEILSARITCQDEDTSEQIFAELNRIATPRTPTATTEVPKPTEEGSAAYGGVCKLNVTADEPTYDHITDAIASGGANKLAGWEYVPLPEERPIIAAADESSPYKPARSGRTRSASSPATSFSTDATSSSPRVLADCAKCGLSPRIRRIMRLHELCGPGSTKTRTPSA